MIDYLRNERRLEALEGDTLQPAVEFYRRCDFGVAESGAMPDGRARYRFVWRRPPA